MHMLTARGAPFESRRSVKILSRPSFSTCALMAPREPRGTIRACLALRDVLAFTRMAGGRANRHFGNLVPEPMNTRPPMSTIRCARVQPIYFRLAFSGLLIVQSL